MIPPLPAAVLGLIVGAAFVLVSKWASRFLTPEDPVIGMAKVLVVNSVGMVVAVASVAAFFFWDRVALPWYGLALVAGFLIVASVELFKFGSGAMPRRTHKK